MKYLKFVSFVLAATITPGFAYAENSNDPLSIEYLEVSKTKETFDMTIEAYVQQFKAQNPGMDEGKLREFLQANMGWEVLKDSTIAIVSNTFTAQELEDIIAFYKTPSGRSYAEKSPQLSADVSTIIATNFEKAMSKLQQ